MSNFVQAAQTLSLRCHPATSNAAVRDIDVTVQRLSALQLQLRYRVSADLAQLRIPTIVTAQRCDELWRHTCAELFVATPDQAAYVEFNFSPSSCWAAYEFSGYRQAMHTANVGAPIIVTRQSGEALDIDVTAQLPETFAGTAVLQASLTMVIEDPAGQYSYWAVHHAAAKPDFHRRDSFVLNV